MAPAIGRLLKRTRQVRALSATEVARAAGISAAYLSKLENDAVKKPSPPVLHQLSEALAVPYAELMRLSGYPVPGEDPPANADTIGAALFADITDGRARRAARVPRLVSNPASIASRPVAATRSRSVTGRDRRLASQY